MPWKELQHWFDVLITKNVSHREWLASLEPSRNNPPVDNPVLEDMDDPFFEIIEKPESEIEVPSTVPAKSKIQTEWEIFSAMPATKQPVLEFWRDNKDKFPLLSEAARKWLCIPASSAPCKRIFSAGGNIVSAKRTKLQPENVKKLIYIQQNIDRITFHSYYLTTKAELATMAEEAAKRLPSRAIFEPETSSQISRSALDRLSSREVINIGDDDDDDGGDVPLDSSHSTQSTATTFAGPSRTPTAGPSHPPTPGRSSSDI
ncbi:uncharacterized protein LOC136083810 [Hydra vulgaris]|uniref:Uncharacterized protein LOC136083810 n=1 Tax=Hydra vulgaris TaxID=6087 RepID=A0ABM4CDF8_HYDVU